MGLALVVAFVTAVGAAMVSFTLMGHPRTFVVVSLACIAPWALDVAYYVHLAPFESSAYYEWRSHAVVDALAGFIGVPIGGVLGSVLEVGRRHGPRKPSFGALTTAVVVIVVLELIAFAKPVMTRLPSSSIHETWKDGVCIQSTPATCGPCSAATILRSLGDESAGEAVLAEAAQTTSSGTLNWLVARAVRERGFSATFREPSMIDDVRPPAIVGVTLGEGPTAIGHFVSLLSKDGDRLVVADSLHGRAELTRAELAKRYRFARFALEITRAE